MNEITILKRIVCKRENKQLREGQKMKGIFLSNSNAICNGMKDECTQMVITHNNFPLFLNNKKKKKCMIYSIKFYKPQRVELNKRKQQN